MKKLIWLLLLLPTFQLNAQTVEIVKKVSANATTDKQFEFLHEDIKISSVTFIATLRASGKEKNAIIPKLFFKLRDKSHELGGNSFKLVSYEKRPPGEATLVLDVFNAAREILKTNRSYEEVNTLFVFLDEVGDEEYVFVINEIDRKIKSGAYYRYDIPEGRQVDISEGGLMSGTQTFRWKEKQPTIFFTLTDFGLPPHHNEPVYIARYFNTKRLNQIDRNLGKLLITLLKPI